MVNGWTLERKHKQAELIRLWKPWEHSTGPITDSGKARASHNAYKGAIRPRIREMARLIKNQKANLHKMK